MGGGRVAPRGSSRRATRTEVNVPVEEEEERQVLASTLCLFTDASINSLHTFKRAVIKCIHRKYCLRFFTPNGNSFPLRLIFPTRLHIKVLGEAGRGSPANTLSLISWSLSDPLPHSGIEMCFNFLLCFFLGALRCVSSVNVPVDPCEIL